MKKQLNGRIALTQLTTAAVFMALTIAFCSFSIPVPGGHLYFCDVAICTAALLLDPFLALIVGGVGAFLGDFIFYPLPMFVSLVTHGLQALVISLFARYVLKKKPKLSSAIGLALGIVILVTGYSLGRAYIYATPAYALAKLPYEFLQGLIGAVAAMFLYWKTPLRKIYARMTGN